MDLFAGGEVGLGPGWTAFAEPESYVRYAAILVLATLSGALLAYHPVHRGRPRHVADLEQQKTLIIYAVVGALIAIICTVNPSMAFVIFGIGGLMRFRTDVGASKSTGHTIMGTLIGLCWGLGLELVAAFATLFFWSMIYLLERAPVVQLTVGGVAVADMGRATDAYRTALSTAGAGLTAHSKNFKKGQMTFVFRVPRDGGMERVATAVQQLPEDLRGTPDWPD
jgi:hypothetical protein